MIGFIHLLGIPIVAMVVGFYLLGHLIAFLGATLITLVWLVIRAIRWAWIKTWLWTVDRRVPRAI